MLFQKSSNFQKQDELMEYDQKMDMHALFYHEFNSNSNNTNMHARNALQSTINEPIHDLALQSNLNHARTSSIHTQASNYSTLGLHCKARGSN